MARRSPSWSGSANAGPNLRSWKKLSNHRKGAALRGSQRRRSPSFNRNCGSVVRGSARTRRVGVGPRTRTLKLGPRTLPVRRRRERQGPRFRSLGTAALLPWGRAEVRRRGVVLRHGGGPPPQLTLATAEGTPACGGSTVVREWNPPCPPPQLPTDPAPARRSRYPRASGSDSTSTSTYFGRLSEASVPPGGGVRHDPSNGAGCPAASALVDGRRFVRDPHRRFTQGGTFARVDTGPPITSPEEAIHARSCWQ